ncbi:hypothetical protein GCM10010300_81060 [Streptomyces olivaceoviridis]|uniref:DUF6881 domain-containing protein n=1 Tax=Streptomyces olivaceoviridis TaxID=1921 RepID=UPI001676EF4B|nr:hypothetical protein [Streptomyces olivaceoviridis]GGZ25476.1 hypothetical protein GCM10010300_81060 [Streptomyces olivaceoviridis]
MRYVKVAWDHNFADDPVLYLSELGDDGYETRKVQIYRDGRSEWADESNETATVGLSEVPFPPLEEISSQPEFTAEVITPQEFERAWSEAHANS